MYLKTSRPSSLSCLRTLRHMQNLENVLDTFFDWMMTGLLHTVYMNIFKVTNRQHCQPRFQAFQRFSVFQKKTVTSLWRRLSTNDWNIIFGDRWCRQNWRIQRSDVLLNGRLSEKPALWDGEWWLGPGCIIFGTLYSNWLMFPLIFFSNFYLCTQSFCHDHYWHMTHLLLT